MAYYHDIVTRKSWEELQNLNKLSDFVLIGGWATYLYTKNLKSKDIDILINYGQLQNFDREYDLYKNERLKKYEAVKGEVQIDVYLPFFSEIGIPVEKLMKNVKSIDSFNVLEINHLVPLKIYTLHQRGRSTKGRKDLLDIISLVQLKTFSYERTKKVIKEHGFVQMLKTLKTMLAENTQIQELNLSTHNFSKVKKEVLAGFKNI